MVQIWFVLKSVPEWISIEPVKKNFQFTEIKIYIYLTICVLPDFL